MRIIFMGTPDFAVPPLEALIASGHEILSVITQPDREKGRGRTVQMSPVKECAVAHGLPVFQPARVKNEEATAAIRELAPDLIVVAAYGQILSQEILDIPAYGCINVHASLLPRHRGAAPIQWAILKGDDRTGVTIMQMDAGMDTGDILLQKEIPLHGTETAEELYTVLAELGAAALTEAMEKLQAGTLTAVRQEEAAATYTKMIRKEMGEISWTASAVGISRLVRAMNSWPCAYTRLRNKMLRIWSAQPADGSFQDRSAEPGTVIAVTKDALQVACGEGVLSITELQVEGKKRMSAHEFLLGAGIRAGEDKLG